MVAQGKNTILPPPVPSQSLPHISIIVVGQGGERIYIGIIGGPVRGNGDSWEAKFRPTPGGIFHSFAGDESLSVSIVTTVSKTLEAIYASMHHCY